MDTLNGNVEKASLTSVLKELADTVEYMNDVTSYSRSVLSKLEPSPESKPKPSIDTLNRDASESSLTDKFAFNIISIKDRIDEINIILRSISGHIG